MLEQRSRIGLFISLLVSTLLLVATPAANASEGSITGKVTELAKSAPVASIQVCATNTSGVSMYRCASTQTDGTYSIPNLPTGPYLVWFAPEQSLDLAGVYYGGGTNRGTAQTVNVEPGQAVSGIDAKLPQGGHISGKAVDQSTNAGLAGVTVCAYPEETEALWSSSCDVSDSGGAYTLPGLSTSKYIVVFERPGTEGGSLTQYYNGRRNYSEAQGVSVAAGAAVGEIDASLPQEGVIKGTVSGGASHEALQGVFVCALGEEGIAYQCASTDSTGAYSISGLYPGEYKVEYQAFHQDAARFFDEATSLTRATPISVASGATVEGINASLPLGGQIKGRVTEQDTGNAVANAEICASPTEGTEEDCARSDAEGNYDIVALAAGSFYVEFRSPSAGLYTQYYRNHGNRSEADVVTIATEGVAEHVDAALSGPGTITGKVTGGVGREALSGVSVCAVSQGIWTGCSFTDSSGEYSIGGIPPGEYLVEAQPFGTHYLKGFFEEAASAAEARPISVTGGTTTTGVDVNLSTGGQISGTVKEHATGASLSSVQVCPLKSATERVGSCTYTDSEGNYTLTGLAPGSYYVEFHGLYSPRLFTAYYKDVASVTEATAVTVKLGEPQNHIDASPSFAGSISGRVTSVGAGVPGVEVCVLGSGACGTTSSNGSYTITGLGSGHYTVEFLPNTPDSTGANYASQYFKGAISQGTAQTVSIQRTGPTEGIDAELVEGGVVAGTVTDAATGKPISGVTICPQGELSMSCGTSDAAGNYRVAGLAQGSYRLYASTQTSEYEGRFLGGSGSYQEATLLKIVAGGNTSAVNIALTGTTGITGTVTDAITGARLYGVEVCALALNEAASLCAVSSYGTYHLTGLKPGSYKIIFAAGEEKVQGTTYFTQYFKSAGSLATATILEVASGSTVHEVDAALRPREQISGTVLGEEAFGGLPSVSVCAEEPANHLYGGCVQTNASGEYGFSALQPGEWVLYFNPSYLDQLTGDEYLAQYYREASTPATATKVTVAAGAQETEINATLRLAGRISGHAIGADTKTGVEGVSICAQGVGVYSCTHTDGAGEYTIGNLPQGSYTVSFSAPYERHYAVQYFAGASSRAAATPVAVEDGALTGNIDAELVPLGKITGTVKRAGSGEPLEGITVCASQTYYNEHCTESTKNGEYSLAGLAAGEYKVSFSASHGGFVSQYFHGKSSYNEATPVSTADGLVTTEVDAEMVALGSISGTVRSVATGEGLPESTVCAYKAGTVVACVGSDAQGRYTLTELSAGEYVIGFFTIGFGSQFYDDQRSFATATKVSVASGKQTTAIDGALLGGVITGKVSGSASEAGVEGVSVCAYTTDYSTYRCVKSDATGAYRITGLPAGSYIVRFDTLHLVETGHNLLSQFYNGISTEGSADEVVVDEEHTSPGVDATLGTGGRITGEVINGATHEALSGAKACPEDQNGSEVGPCATTNAQGEYDIVGLPTGEYWLQYFAQGSTAGYWPNVEARSEATPISVTAGKTAEGVEDTLAALGNVRGHVRDAATGEALPEVYVCAYYGGSAYVRECTRTDGAGAYQLTSLPSGEYDLLFEDSQGRYLSQWYQGKTSRNETNPVTVVPNKSAENIDAALMLGGVITGNVTSASDGSSVTGVTVCARQGIGPEAPETCASTDASGNYVLKQLSSGSYTIEFDPEVIDRAGKANYLKQFYGGVASEAEATQTLVAAGLTTGHIDAALGAGAELMGTVTGAPQKTPTSGIYVCALTTSGETVKCEYTDAHGGYALGGLPSGSYKLQFQPPWYLRYVAQYYNGASTLGAATVLSLVAGEPPRQIDAELTDFGRVKGRVISAEASEPIQGITVCAMSGAYPVACESTDAEGNYEIAGIPEGEYTIRFDAGGVDSEAKANFITAYYSGALEVSGATGVSVAAGQTLSGIDEALLPGGEISGSVTGTPSNAGVAGVVVCPVDALGSTLADCATTDGGGHYTLVGLSTGGYVLSFTPEGPSAGRMLSELFGGVQEYSEASVVPVTQGKAVSGIDQALTELGTIAGKVTSASAPGGVAAVSVCARPAGEHGYVICMPTSATGEYTLTGLSPGRYEVLFDPSAIDASGANYLEQLFEGAQSEQQAKPVEVGAGGNATGVDAKLAEGAQITGRVTSQESGAGLAHLTVCVSNSTVRRCALTGATGGYAISALPAGSYTIGFGMENSGIWFPQYYNAQAEEGQATPVVLATGQLVQGVNAAMARGRISGRVLDAVTKKPIAGAEICAAATGIGFFGPCASSDEQGLYALEGLSVGDYDVRFRATGYPDQYYLGSTSLAFAQPVAISATSTASGIDAQLANLPSSTRPPVVLGTSTEGQTLSLEHGEWTNAPTSYDEQWERCDSEGHGCASITSAEGATYVLVAGDVGHVLRVSERGVNAAGAGVLAASSVTQIVKAAPPTVLSSPEIAGEAREGRTLIGEHGSWSNEPESFEYQWLRCDESEACQAISGASHASYTAVTADVGSTLELRVSAVNSTGTSAPSVSGRTQQVLPLPPSALTPPQIVGVARVGEKLHVQRGVWTGEPRAYEYHWLQCDSLGQSCVGVGSGGPSLQLGHAQLGSRIEVVEIASNTGGAGEAVSEATESVVANPPVNMTPPAIVGHVEVNQPLVVHHGAWTGESTSFEDQWLRCEAGGHGCQPIEGATSLAYQVTASDLGHSLVVREVATGEGGTSSPSDSAPTSLIEQSPLIASAGETLITIAGAPARLDASGSSPASEISSYEWDFGDGTSGSGSTASHSYAKPGEYSATVTVHRGGEVAHQHVTVTVEPASTGNVRISTESSQGQMLSGVTVLIMPSGGGRIEGTSDSSGTAVLASVPEGVQTAYAWAPGYQPAVVQIAVSQSGGEAVARLTEGELAKSSLKSHEMNLEEIEAAGIDPTEPGNNRVFEFEIRLAFFENVETPKTVTCRVNAEGQFVGGCTGGSGGTSCVALACYWGGGGGGAGGGGGGAGGGGTAVATVVNGHPLIQWLILKGKATILKQFFSVAMVTQNLSPAPFSLAHGQAVLSLPPGLSLAPTATPQSLTQAVPDIPGGGSATSEWVVRGDEAGNYYLSAGYTGKLEPIGAPVDTQATLATPLRVWGIEALALSVQADNSALQEGVPYHVTVAVTNKAEVPMYNIDLAIAESVHSNFIFQPNQRFHRVIAALQPGQTIVSNQLILVPDANSVGKFNPGLSSATFVGQQVHPGEGIQAVTPPPTYSLAAPTDTPFMVHLHWQSVPGAEGYEVFPTQNLDTAFSETPESVMAEASAPEPVTQLPHTATDAFIAGDPKAPPRYYAVSALINGQPTLEAPVIPATAGAPPPPAPGGGGGGGVAGYSSEAEPGSEQGAGASVPSCALHSIAVGGITVQASCFNQVSKGVFTATGSLRVNGLDIKTSGQVQLDTSTLELVSSGSVEVHVGSTLIYQGQLDWKFQATLTLGIPAGATIKGLPLAGQATVSLIPGGAKIVANAVIKGGSFQVTGRVTLEVALQSGLRLKGLSVELESDLPIKGIVVKKAKLGYHSTAGHEIWEGSIEVELPAKLPTVKGQLVVTNGSISLVEVVVSKLNKYIAYGVFLQELGMKVVIKPPGITGSIGLSAGPNVLNHTAASLKGSLGASFGSPVTIEAQGTLSLVNQTMASSWIKVMLPGGVSFGGEENRSIGPVGIRGTIAGHISSSEFEAQGKVTLSAAVASASGLGLVNTEGLAGCAAAKALGKTFQIGGWYRWNGEKGLLSAACGFSQLRAAVASARVAGATIPVSIPAGTRQLNLVVRGDNAPPSVTVTAAGQTAVVTPDSVGRIGQAVYISIGDPEEDETYIAIVGLPTGALQVSSAGAGAQITSVASALTLPDPRVRVRIQPAGGRHFRIVWSARAIPGQTLMFQDVDARGQTVVLKTKRSHGSAVFVSPRDGAIGHHSLRVVVEQYGLTREAALRASFIPPTLRLSAPRVKIRVVRGTGTLTWQAVPGATGYQVSVSTSDGRQLYFRKSAQVRSLRVAHVSRMRARVQALGAATEVGPAASAVTH